jgi:hypothetical protein
LLLPLLGVSQVENIQADSPGWLKSKFVSPVCPYPSVLMFATDTPYLHFTGQGIPRLSHSLTVIYAPSAGRNQRFFALL